MVTSDVGFLTISNFYAVYLPLKNLVACVFYCMNE